MIRNYFKIAWRNLWKHKTYSFLNIFGLALGMSIAILIALWVRDELSYNSYFKNKNKIARVIQHQTFNGVTDTEISIPRPLEMVLKNQYQEYFEEVAMSSWNSSNHLHYNNKDLSREGYFIDESIVDLLHLKIMEGDKNGLLKPNSIMLSQSCAKALFDHQNPLGKIIEVSKEYQMEVTAIYEDIPYNNDFHDADFMMPWKFYTKTQPWIRNSIDQWTNNSFQVFVRIGQHTTIAKASSAIKDIKKNADPEARQYNPEFELFPMSEWHLQSSFKNGKQIGGRIEYVWMFSIIGVFVILLACINFMNLSTARSHKRAKEVGIRKAIGSGRKLLITQFLSESFLFVILAFTIALLFTYVSLSGFNTLTRKEIVFPWNSSIFWCISFLFVCITAFISGSYPALYLSGFRPAKVLKGSVHSGKNSGLFRKILVVTQFTVSTILIIGTVTVFRQINHTKNRPVGYTKEGLIQIPLSGPDFLGKYEQMRHAFLQSGAVMEMSASSSPATDIWATRSGYNWQGKPPGFQDEFACVNVTYDYVNTLGLNIISGRDFSRDFPSDTNAVLINKTAVQYMGLKDPIGKYLIPDQEEVPPLQIIGIVDDIVMESPYEPVRQTIFAFDKYESVNFYNLRLSPDKSLSPALKTIENVFKKNFPDIPFRYQFTDDTYRQKFASEERVADLAGIFTILAIIISCLGLFGLASFVAEQRTKELGIRKVLGAGIFNLWLLLTGNFIALVLLSLFIASPIAYYFLSGWIEQYSYRIEISFWLFAFAGILTLSIAWVTVSFQALKAALSNPVKSLKTDG